MNNMNLLSRTVESGKQLPLISLEPGMQVNALADVTRTIAILTGIIIR